MKQFVSKTLLAVPLDFMVLGYISIQLPWKVKGCVFVNVHVFKYGIVAENACSTFKMNLREKCSVCQMLTCSSLLCVDWKLNEECWWSHGNRTAIWRSFAESSSNGEWSKFGLWLSWAHSFWWGILDAWKPTFLSFSFHLSDMCKV